jgi:hypothetical protein
MNYLCPLNKNGPWTLEEDDLLARKVRELGCHWATISKCFDGRSENNVKNRWYSYVRAKQAQDRSSEGISKRQPLPSIGSITPSILVHPTFDTGNCIPTMAPPQSPSSI